jgi:hypothetical protein
MKHKSQVRSNKKGKVFKLLKPLLLLLFVALNIGFIEGEINPIKWGLVSSNWGRALALFLFYFTILFSNYLVYEKDQNSGTNSGK